MNAHDLKKIHLSLKHLLKTSSSIRAIALMSRDGLLIDSVMIDHSNPDRLSAMSSSLISIAEKIAEEINQGKMKKLLIDNEKGFFLLLKVGQNAVLSVVSEPSSKLGMLLHEAQKTAVQVSELVRETGYAAN